MIKVDLTDESATVSGVVDWVLGLFAIIGAPDEKLFARDLYLPAVPYEVDSKLGVAEVALDT